MRKTELLIPASSLEVLKIAVTFGADAVYIGGEAFGLRAKAKNFSPEEMKEGIEFAHARGVKVYVTANILAHNYDLEGARAYFKELKEIGPDALIIADPGMFTLAKEICPEIDVHISTQANNTNYETYRFWVTAIIAALIGSWFGARLALLVENDIFKIIMLVILPITAIFVLNKRVLSKYRCPYTTRQTKTIITLLALFMGLYDGFYGPGTGTFLMLMLVGIAHISLEQAVGTTKVINLSTNLASLSVYLVHGKVLFPLALIAALFGIAGNYIGARHFTRKGAKFVKPIIITVLAIFFVKLCWELFIAKQ